MVLLIMLSFSFEERGSNRKREGSKHTSERHFAGNQHNGAGGRAARGLSWVQRGLKTTGVCMEGLIPKHLESCPD